MKKKFFKVFVFLVLFLIVYLLILPEDKFEDNPLGLKLNQKYIIRMDGYKIIGKIMEIKKAGWLQVEVLFDSSFSIKAKFVLINLQQISIIEETSDRGD